MRLDEPMAEAIARLKMADVRRGLVEVSDLTGELLCNACDELGVAGHEVESLRRNSGGARPDGAAWSVPLVAGNRDILLGRILAELTDEELREVIAHEARLTGPGGWL